MPKTMNRIHVRLTTRERDSILAGLRMLQAYRDAGELTPDVLEQIDEIATDSGPAMNVDHIDRLCERLNDEV